jgi:uncharacterized membrane protein
VTPYLFSVTLHVLAAFLWVGGLFFLAAVGAPVLRRVEQADLRARLFQSIGERFRLIGWIAIAILVLSGFGNLHFRGLLRMELLGDPAFWTRPYGRTLAWKLAIVTTMAALAALHDFVLGPRASRLAAGSAGALRARHRAAWLARVNTLLGILLIAVSVRLARGG